MLEEYEKQYAASARNTNPQRNHNTRNQITETIRLRDGQVLLPLNPRLRSQAKVKPHKGAGNVSAIFVERLDIPTVTED